MVKKESPAGSTVTKEESKNELEEANVKQGKPSSIENFLVAMKEEEERKRRATSGDLEVIKDVSPKQLLELQGINIKGTPTGEAPRLYGYDPKTKTALVLKEVFIKEQKAKGK